jgi:hypothetical protein
MIAMHQHVSTRCFVKGFWGRVFTDILERTTRWAWQGEGYAGLTAVPSSGFEGCFEILETSSRPYLLMGRRFGP